MIVGALLGSILIYVLGVVKLHLKTKNYCVADIGFLFLTLGFCYTAAPALTFLFLDLGSVAGWPWMELSRLDPGEGDLAVHIWRHNLFLGVFIATYLFVRGGVEVTSFERSILELRQFVRWGDLFMLASVVCISTIISKSFLGDVDVYVDKYLASAGLGHIEKLIWATFNRVAAGAQYLMIVVLALVPMRKLPKALVFFLLLIVQLLISTGSRIEVFFLILASGVVFEIFVQKVELKYLVIGGFFSLLLMWFLEVFRFYNFDLALTLEHFYTFGIQPVAELGSVFFTGFHLYSLAESNQLPLVNNNIFYYDVLSLFFSNSDLEFSPQYWYWQNFYPDSLVPPQTNGPIADSAIWGMGVLDLAIRACIIGCVFGWVARNFFNRQPSMIWTVVYVFYCATCVMNLKYGVLWQLNPLVKTMLPTLIVFGLYRLFLGVRGRIR